MKWLGAALAAVCGVACALAGVAYAQAPPHVQRLTQYGHTSWQVQDGQFSSPNGIAQTKDGYLWLPTDGGLVRFDGVRFVNRPHPALSGRPATAIHAAADGGLWVGRGAVFVRLKEGQTSRYSFTGQVSQFAEDGTGAVWIAITRTAGSGTPLCRVAGGKLDCFATGEFSYLSALAIDKGGGLWIGGSKGLCHWSQSQMTRCYRPDALKPRADLASVNALLTTRDGTLWVGFGAAGRDLGLGQFTDGKWKPFVADGLDGSSLAVSSLMEDRDGALWVGTIDQGIYRIQGGRAEHFGRADGLSSDTVSGTLYQDQEGTVWVLTASGLDAFRRLLVSVFSVREGLPADRVESVLAARDGTVWFGNQTLSTLSNDEPAPAPHQELFRGKEVTSLLEDHAGRLWIGLQNTLNVFDQGVLRPVRAADGAALGVIERIVEDTRHDVWVTTAAAQPQLLRIRDGGVVERIDGSGPFPANFRASALAPDPKGGVVLGLWTGQISTFRDGKLETYAAEAAASTPINGLLVDADGTVLATTLRGLLVRRGALRRLMNTESGLPCDRLRVAVRDRLGDLWLRSDCGIILIGAAELARWLAEPASKIEARLFDVTDGARTGFASFMPAASVGPDGRLWFATGKVAQVIDPALIATRRPAPDVRIEEITADRTVFEPAGPLKLPARTRDLELRYTALSFIAPQKIKFRYRLEGRDRAWTDAGTRRTASYTDLPPGNYRFRVTACNADGIWNETGASQDFEVPPLFYQTTWFFVLSGVVAVFALYGFFVLRMRQVAVRVRDRLAAKSAERERIARELHDTLLQSTEALILQVQAAANCIAEGDPARDALGKALDRADQVVAEGRDRVQDLRTSESISGDLSRSLAAVGQEWAKASGTEFRMIVEGPSRALKPTVMEETYRIGREALLNANRHAAARMIEVQIIHGDTDFRLRIRDDGVGIDTGTGVGGLRVGHWGLTGMRERALKIGAEFDIWSRPGAGTEIELRLSAELAYVRRASRLRWLPGLRFVGD
jgi:signal transduction histidine kinase/ligand-binding sensor domain-containing protein